MNKVITFGEVLLRLAVPDRLRFTQTQQFNVTFCGSEVNVSASLASLGVQTEFVTCMPKNEMAEACVHYLKAHSIGLQHILYSGERLGLFYLETGAVARPSKVIYDRTNSSFAGLQTGMLDWETILHGAKWFHWSGITPAVSKNVAEVCMEGIQKAKELGLTVSCDLNYRNKLWNYGVAAGEIMEPMVTQCDYILGNEEDCEHVFGVKAQAGVNHDQYKAVCSMMLDRFPKATAIALTLRDSINADINNWSSVFMTRSEFITSKQYAITDIVDRVGAGDSFMAGLIYSLLEGYNDALALEFATAASCLKHTILGDFNLVSKDEILRLVEGNATGRVIR